MGKKLAGLIIAAAAAIVPQLAVGAVIVYTDEAAYNAAVGATRTYIDFAGGAGTTVSGGSFSPNVTFGSCTDYSAPGSCGTSVLHDSGHIGDLGGSIAPNGVASLAWRFNLSDIFAFSFNYLSGQIDSINLVDTGSNITAIDTLAATTFIGLVSDTAFYGAIAVNAVFPGGGNDRYYLDDFRINERAAVPEPATLLLMLAGLMAITAGGLGRRRT